MIGPAAAPGAISGSGVAPPVAPASLVATRIEPGPVFALAGLAAGLLAGERAGPDPAAAILAVGAAGMLASWFLMGRARAAMAVIALALLGTASMQRALDGLVDSPLVQAAREGTEVLVRGTLVTDPDGPRFGADALLRVEEDAEPGGAWRPTNRIALVRASGDEAGRLRVLAAGDRVTLTGVAAPLEGFDSRRRWQHAVALVRDAEILGFSAPSGQVAGLANRLRSVVLRGGEALPTTERALLAGFLLGDTREIPDAVVDDFRSSGLSHLLAVSGANVAFALAVARPVLRRSGIAGRFAGGLGVVLLFATMTRFEPSVLRASALAAASMSAVFLGRPSGAMRLLVTAIAVLLLADPFLVHSVGFALSCSASAGIALLASRLAPRMRGPVWVREPLAVTVAAQLGVAPVIVPVFGSMPAITPVANLLAVPVADFLGVYGLVAGAVGGIVEPVAPAASAALQWPAAAGVRWIAGVADLSARVPLSLDGRALAVLAVGGLAAWAMRRAPGAARRGPGSLRFDERDALPDHPTG